MIKVKLQQRVNATPDVVCALLLEHDKLNRFFNADFKQTKAENKQQPSGGAGTIRQVSLHGQTFFEQIISATTQHICYRIIGKGPVYKHQGDILLSENIGGTTIDYTIVCQAPWWQPNIIVQAIITRDIKQALAKLARYCDES